MVASLLVTVGPDPVSAAPGDIRTLAGGRGDGGAATAARFLRLEGAAVDSAGNVYVADTDDHRVRKISAAGSVTTAAGTDEFGFSGDGGPATSAKLWAPYGVAVESAGNLLIADTGNSRIRKVSTTGTITTVAGNGTNGFSGDGGPATSAALWFPRGVTVDSGGNLLVADGRNHRIRKVSTTGTITTVAGNGTAGFGGDGGSATAAALKAPEAVVADAVGNLYIADTENHRVRKVNASGTISTFAGTGVIGYSGDGGPATSARIWFPRDVGLDAAGNLYIADGTNYVIRKISPGGTITTVAGNGSFGFSGDGGPATGASMGLAHGVAVSSSGTLYIPEVDHDRVRKVDTSGTINTIAGTGPGCVGSGDGGQASAARLCDPTSVAADSAGTVYIVDAENHRVRKVATTGVISGLAGTGTAGFSGDGGTATAARLSSPRGTAVDGTGNVYVADTGNHRVRRIDAAGTITTVAGTGTPGFVGDGTSAVAAQLSSPQGVAADGAGNVYIADTGNHRIRRVDPAGVISTVAGTGTGGFSGDGSPAVLAQFNSPTAVAVDSGGNLFVADTANSRVRKVRATGTVVTVAGNGSGYSGDGGPATSAGVPSPVGVAVDAGGNLFIGTSGHRVRRVNASGTISTVAGSGTFGFAGDGGPAVNAQFRYVGGVAVDGSGNLYIADTGNQRVRKVEGMPPSPPLASSKTVSLSPVAQTRTIGTSATLVARVIDQDNRPVMGATVTFVRTGANPSSSVGTTNAAGEVAYGYAGSSPGHDVIEAGVSGASSSTVAGVTWTYAEHAVGEVGFRGTAHLPTFPCDRDPLAGDPCPGGSFSGDWTAHVSGVKGSTPYEAVWTTATGEGVSATFSYTEWQCLEGTETVLGFATGRGTASAGPGEVNGEWQVPGESFGRDIIGASMTFDFRWTRVTNGAVITLQPATLTLEVAGLGGQTVVDGEQQGTAAFLLRSSDNTTVPTCDSPLTNVQGDIAGAILLTSPAMAG